MAARSLCLTSRKLSDIRTIAVALVGVVESMVSWKIYENDTTSEIIFGPIV